jgi:hypothetical protein
VPLPSALSSSYEKKQHPLLVYFLVYHARIRISKTSERLFTKSGGEPGNLTFQEISDPLTHRRVIRLWISYPPKLFSANKDPQKDRGV